jgi:four helix bundle protein
MRRAAASIPTNIADGCWCDGEGELGRFMQTAMGSASELEYLLLLANDLVFLEKSLYEQIERDTTEVKRMLTAFILKLKADR